MVRSWSIFCVVLTLLVAVNALCETAMADDSAGDKSAVAETEQERQAILAQPTISLADLIRLAEIGSPALAAARSSVQARAGHARQAAAYPNPTFEIGMDEVSTSDPDFRKDKVALVLPVVLSGRRGDATKAARADRSAAEEAFAVTHRDVQRRVQALWAEHLYFRAAAAAYDTMLAVANRTLDIAEARFEARAAPEAQVTRALLEVYDLEVGRQQLDREQIRASAELAAQLGGIQIAIDRIEGNLKQAALDGPQAASLTTPPAQLAQHPAVRSAELSVDAAAAALSAARAARFPDLDLTLAYGKYRPVNEGFVEIGISVPLPLFDRSQGRIAANQSLVAYARHEARVVADQFGVALATARANYLTTRDQLAASADRIEPVAKRGLAQAQEGYRVGRLEFLELLDAQRTLATVRLRTLELRRDLVVAGAELMSLAGESPDGKTGEVR